MLRRTALLALLLVGCGDDAPPTPPPSACEAIDASSYYALGGYAVGKSEVVYYDDTRPTMANGAENPGDPNGRSLDTTLWYPATADGDDTPIAGDGPFPLIVYSHGFSSSKGEGDYVFPQLASRGYIIIAPTFPLTHLGTVGGPNSADVVNQPGDVSFLLDTLLAKNADVADPLYGAIDETRIAAAGLSMGGMTTLLVSFHETMGDPRIDLAAAIAPASMLFNADFYDFVSIPLLLVAGDIDDILDYEQNALAAFANANAPATLVTISNGTHTGFASYATLFDGYDNADSVGCNALGGIGGGGDASATWDVLIDDLGGAAAGIEDPGPVYVCATDPLPPGMCPTHQLGLTAETLQAYLDSQFAPNALDRDAAVAFLAAQGTLHPEVSVQSK